MSYRRVAQIALHVFITRWPRAATRVPRACTAHAGWLALDAPGTHHACTRHAVAAWGHRLMNSAIHATLL